MRNNFLCLLFIALGLRVRACTALFDRLCMKTFWLDYAFPMIIHRSHQTLRKRNGITEKRRQQVRQVYLF